MLFNAFDEYDKVEIEQNIEEYWFNLSIWHSRLAAYDINYEYQSKDNKIYKIEMELITLEMEQKWTIKKIQ
jgi:HD superfamily phosphohydrolase YqeK